MGKAKGTLEERLEKKNRAFQMLAEGKSITVVSEALDINKGSISRWRRSKEFAIWKAHEAGHTAIVTHQGQDPSLQLEDTETRGKFLQALRLGGRIDVAAAYAGVKIDQLARWLVEESAVVYQAQAESYLRAAQTLRAAMDGKDLHGNPLEVKAADRIRAATEFIRLHDYRREDAPPQVRIQMPEATRTDSTTPLTIIVDSVRRELGKVEDIDLLDIVDVEAS